jgi:hypothetical protein
MLKPKSDIRSAACTALAGLFLVAPSLAQAIVSFRPNGQRLEHRDMVQVKTGRGGPVFHSCVFMEVT